MAYAEVSDLQTYMASYGPVDEAQATLAIQLVSDEIDAYLGLPTGVTLLGGTYTDQLLDGPAPGSSTLVLPEHPVTAVDAVSVMRAPGDWCDLVYEADYLWSANGIVTRISTAYEPYGPIAPFWPRYPQSIRVTWTAGYAEAPAAIRSVVLSAAARLVANALGLTAIRVGGESYTFSRGQRAANSGIATGSGGVEFNALEEAALGRFLQNVGMA